MEVCIEGVWRILCQEGVDLTDVRVMCTQLGFSKATSPPSFCGQNVFSTFMFEDVAKSLQAKYRPFL